MKSKVFIGSSSQSLPVANALARQLEELAAVEVQPWNKYFFNLNRGILEDLLNQLEEFDFAVLVLAPDDVAIINDQLSFSTRDNVLFELGLFMGRLGRDRVFVACDNRIDLHRPSDLLGVTLALYDGSRIGESTVDEAVRDASHRIAEAIKKPTLSHIVGEWRSKYRLIGDPNHPLAEEDVEVTASKAGVSITNKNNSQNDYYIARANLTEQGLLYGKWRTIASLGSTNGVFLLTKDPRGKVMYGYVTGLDERSGTIYGTWVLAKKDGADELEIAKRLKQGEGLLKSTILTWPMPSDDV